MRLALALLLFASAAAGDESPRLARGSLVFESTYTNASRQTTWTGLAVAPDGAVTTLRPPYSKDGWAEIFLAPAPDRVFRLSPGEIFLSTDDFRTWNHFFWPRNERATQQMAPMHGGQLLVLQVHLATGTPFLVRLDANGAVADTYTLPAHGGHAPSWQLDVLGDRCTVLYAGSSWPDDTAHRIRRYDLCTRSVANDFASIDFSFGEQITAIRQLPGGDVLIASQNAVRHYTRDGVLVREYPYPARELALTPDGRGAWLVEDDRTVDVQPHIRRLDLAAQTVAVFEPEIGASSGFNGFTVVGEWRAATHLPLETGDVLVYSMQPMMCTCPIADQFAVLDANGALKASSELRATGLLAPSADRLLASQGSHVDAGGMTLLAGRGHKQLGEIVRTRAGHYLVVETSSGEEPPAVVRFTESGEVLDTLRLPQDARAAHIELLSNQCTLLYTAEWHPDAAEARRVRKFNVCRGRDEGVLFSLPIDAQLAGAMRQLPGGDLLIATGLDVRRFNLAGHQLAIYDVPATHIALTPDASGFWAVHDRNVQRVDFANPDVIAVSTSVEHTQIGAVAVVGEWRAAATKPKTRATRH